MILSTLQNGRYRILHMLGSGAMGEVHLAEDTRLNRQVAIKVIRAEASPYPNNNAAREATRLFEREARAIAQLNHPNILPLFDFGEENLNKETQFAPGTTWHTYRVEVKTNTIRFLVDGGLILELQDSTYLVGSQVGLFCYSVQLSVSDFKVIGL